MPIFETLFSKGEKMKLVTNTQINGKALRIDEQVACPHCHARAMTFEDGSIACITEGKSFMAEPTDGDAYKRRLAYEAANPGCVSATLDA
ncbi:MAG: hypothetical protein J0H83_18665 [Candidatus Melainabacteria bacterium]|nr:hypothetical protein [Candidatus Melainabacteria bacterium]